MNLSVIKTLLQKYDFQRLFIEELGWDNLRDKNSILLGDKTSETRFELVGIAEKRGVRIYQCYAAPGGSFPDYATRKAIDKKLTVSAQEHLIIFTDDTFTNGARQTWQYALREHGKTPLIREYDSIPLILQKLPNISFSLNEEEGLTLSGVIFKLKDALDKERLTKKFYDAFGKEQQAFLGFIDGIDDSELQQWYASVMISRLMFIYFIQAKGFLDSNPKYLAGQLRESMKQGADKFYSDFLVTLFFEGFAKETRTAQMKKKLGDVPYLNGGLFNKHDIEERYGEKIHISDAAFERLFAFFDKWRWQLDERPMADGNSINPDVLGYIFEKYVNNKQMGAYYTKEDITGYISEFSVLPCIYDKMNLLSQAAASPAAAPADVWSVLPDPNEFITQNKSLQSDLLQRIAETDSLQFIHRLYFQVVKPLKILDPTCGSGAFLFAAIGLLLPLYNALTGRMRQLADELDRTKLTPERLALVAELDGELKRIREHASEDYFILKTIILNNLHGVDIVEEATEICKLRLFLKLMATVETKDQIEPLPDIDFNIKAGNSLVGFATFEQMRQQFETPLGLEAPEEVRAKKITQYITEFQAEMLTGDGQKPETKAKILSLLRELQENLDKKLHGRYKAEVKDFKLFKKKYQPFHWCVDFAGILAQGGFDVIIGNPPYVAVNTIDYSLPEHGLYKFPDIYGYVLVRTLAIGNQTARYGMVVPLSLTFSGDFIKLRQLLVENLSSWFSSYDNIPGALFAGVSQRCTIWLGGHTKPELNVTPMYRWRAEERETLFTKIKYASISDFKISEYGIPKLATQLQEYILNAIVRASQKSGTILSTNKDSKDKLGFSQAARNFISIFLEEPPTIDIDTLKKILPSEIRFLKMKDAVVAKAAFPLLVGETHFWYWLILGDGFHVTNGTIVDFLQSLKGVDEKTLKLLSYLGELLHERRNEALVFKKNAGKYVGNYNFRGHYQITRRADLLLLAALGLESNHAKEVFNYVQQVLSINVFAGEKGIPNTLKAKFPIGKVDDKKQKKIYDGIDAVLAEHYGFTAEELDFIINYDIKYRMGKGSEEAE